MNPFEKVFNYQLMNSLDSSGIFIVTAKERAWLKLMLNQPAAQNAFDAATLEKIKQILAEDEPLDVFTHLMQKGQSKEHTVYHPLIRTLRKLITSHSGIKLSYEIKRGGTHEDMIGVPYKLEFSMIKREWLLIWYHLQHRKLMSTRLTKIVALTSEEIPKPKIERIIKHIERTMESHKTQATILVNSKYNGELSRILYAFSYFEKKVRYNEEEHTYTIEIQFDSSESEFVLSRIRFLGQRVKVTQGEYLQKRLLEAAMKSLERYGE